MTNPLHRMLIAFSLGLAVLGALLTAAPAQAVSTGTLGINVTGRYTGGHTGSLTGAVVKAENLDSGLIYAVPAYGNPATSAYYQGLNLPLGKYRIRIERTGFASMYWPRQFAAQSAATVTFADVPNCNPADAAPCDTHLLTAELPQLVTVSGTVRTRQGHGVAGVSVNAVRDDEPTFRPVTMTDPNGQYALQVPPGGYSLRTANGNDTAVVPVQVDGSLVRDIILLDPPAAPATVQAIAGSRLATVTWQPPIDDGGADITTYTVTAAPGGATCTTPSLTCTVQGLPNGQTRTFTVTAANRVGTSAPSAPSNAVLVGTGIPQPARNVRVTAADRSLEVMWSASASDDVTEYVATAAPGGRSCSTAGLSCAIPGLRNGRAYLVKVEARSQAGTSPAVAADREVRPVGLPGAARNVEVTPRPSALQVTWRAPRDDGGRRITGYTATSWPGGRTCDTDGARRCTIRGLRRATAYTVTVRAENAAGIGMMSPGSVPTSPQAGPGVPPRVKGLRVDVGRTRLTVRWQPAERADSYWIRLTPRGDRPGSWTVVRRASASFAARPGVQTVQVRAHGPGGLSAPVSRRFTGR